MAEYFSNAEGSDARVRVVPANDLPHAELGPGIDGSPIFGTSMALNVVTLEPHAVAAIHTHAEEQVGYVVRGSCIFEDGENRWVLQPGDTYHAPPGAPHGATALEEGCVVIDVFSPPRAALRALFPDGNG